MSVSKAEWERWVAEVFHGQERAGGGPSAGFQFAETADEWRMTKAQKEEDRLACQLMYEDRLSQRRPKVQETKRVRNSVRTFEESMADFNRHLSHLGAAAPIPTEEEQLRALGVHTAEFENVQPAESLRMRPVGTGRPSPLLRPQALFRTMRSTRGPRETGARSKVRSRMESFKRMVCGASPEETLPVNPPSPMPIPLPLPSPRPAFEPMGSYRKIRKLHDCGINRTLDEREVLAYMRDRRAKREKKRRDLSESQVLCDPSLSLDWDNKINTFIDPRQRQIRDATVCMVNVDFPPQSAECPMRGPAEDFPEPFGQTSGVDMELEEGTMHTGFQPFPGQACDTYLELEEGTMHTGFQPPPDQACKTDLELEEEIICYADEDEAVVPPSPIMEMDSNYFQTSAPIRWRNAANYQMEPVRTLSASGRLQRINAPLLSPDPATCQSRDDVFDEYKPEPEFTFNRRNSLSCYDEFEPEPEFTFNRRNSLSCYDESEPEPEFTFNRRNSLSCYDESGSLPVSSSTRRNSLVYEEYPSAPLRPFTLGSSLGSDEYASVPLNPFTLESSIGFDEYTPEPVMPSAPPRGLRWSDHPSDPTTFTTPQRRLTWNEYSFVPVITATSTPRWRLSWNEYTFEPVEALSCVRSVSQNQCMQEPMRTSDFNRGLAEHPSILDSVNNTCEPMRSSDFHRGLEDHPSILDSVNTSRSETRSSRVSTTCEPMRSSDFHRGLEEHPSILDSVNTSRSETRSSRVSNTYEPMRSSDFYRGLEDHPSILNSVNSSRTETCSSRDSNSFESKSMSDMISELRSLVDELRDSVHQCRPTYTA